MLIDCLRIALVIGVMFLPLIPTKTQTKRKAVFKIDTDTSHAEYAVNVNGELERIKHPQHH